MMAAAPFPKRRRQESKALQLPASVACAGDLFYHHPEWGNKLVLGRGDFSVRHPRTLLAVLAAMLLAACQGPQHFEAAKQLRRNTGEARILLMPADIQLSELTAGGVLEPKADWTEAARNYLTTALREEQSARQIRIVDYDESAVPPDRRDEVHQLAKLYSTVGQAIFVHQFGGPLQLPTKAKGFDWSLGPSVIALRQQYGADYALLTYVRDSYSSAGRKALMAVGVVAAAFTGVGVIVPGGRQVAFISLVDLETGDIVWFNRIIRTNGDLRDTDGAHGTAKDLLQGFPK